MSAAVILGVVIARMDSSRLPGKPLLELGGLPLLGHVVTRARAIHGLASLALATTRRPVDDSLADYADQLGLTVFRGDCDDVAGRVLACAESCGASAFVRLNGDSPFLDPQLIDAGLLHLQDGIEFVTNIPGRTFPYGIAVEIIDTACYRRAVANMSTAADREHVTLALYRSLHLIPHYLMHAPHPQLSQARLVVDTPEDLVNAEILICHFGESIDQASYVKLATYWLEHIRAS